MTKFINEETEESFDYYEVTVEGFDETEIVIGVSAESVKQEMEEKHPGIIKDVKKVSGYDLSTNVSDAAKEQHELNVSVLTGNNPFARNTKKLPDDLKKKFTSEESELDEIAGMLSKALTHPTATKNAASANKKDQIKKDLESMKKNIKEDGDFRTKSARAAMTKKDRGEPNPQNKEPHLESTVFTKEEIQALKKLKEHSLEQYFKLLNTLPKQMAEEANEILGVESRSIRQVFADRLIEKKMKMKEGTDLKNDKNHNGIDDDDENEPKDNTVKKTDKLAKEEVEQVDELDKETLKSYYDKSYNHRAHMGGNKNPSDNEKRLMKNRTQGGKRAAAKIYPKPQSVKDRGAEGKANAKQDARNAFIRDKVRPGKK